DHAPHDDSRDLDRVSDVVVHLELGALEVAHAQRDPLLRVEGIGVAQTGIAYRALVRPEELEHAPLVGPYREEAQPGDGLEGPEEDRAQDGEDLVPLHGLKEEPEDGDRRDEQHGESDEPVGYVTLSLAHHAAPPGLGINTISLRFQWSRSFWLF